MKSPVKLLVEEHEIILWAIEIAKKSENLIEKDKVVYEKVIRDLIYFFREYADQYHHHKEENILFPEMNKKQELLEDGIIKEMLENHEDFRDLLKSIETFLNNKDYHGAQQQLNFYSEALLAHIAVEDVEVFQMAEILFDKDELENIYFRFKDIDREIGEENKTKLVDQLTEITALLENT